MQFISVYAIWKFIYNDAKLLMKTFIMLKDQIKCNLLSRFSSQKHCNSSRISCPEFIVRIFPSSTFLCDEQFYFLNLAIFAVFMICH